MGPAHGFPTRGGTAGHVTPSAAASVATQTPPPQSAEQAHVPALENSPHEHSDGAQPCDGSQMKPGSHGVAFSIRAQPAGGGPHDGLASLPASGPPIPSALV